MVLARVRRRLRSKVEILGLSGALRDIAMIALNRLFALRIVHCMAADAAAVAAIWPDERFRYRFLGRDELLAHASDPANELRPSFVRAALERGDQCLAVLDGDVLAGYGWYSHKPTAMTDDLTVSFAEPYVYMYKGFTRVPYRGRRLCPSALSLALRDFAAHGFRGMVAFVDSTNRSSLRAFDAAGFTSKGTVLIARLFGRTWIRASAGCADVRFRVAQERRALPRTAERRRAGDMAAAS